MASCNYNARRLKMQIDYLNCIVSVAGLIGEGGEGEIGYGGGSIFTS